MVGWSTFRKGWKEFKVGTVVCMWNSAWNMTHKRRLVERSHGSEYAYTAVLAMERFGPRYGRVAVATTFPLRRVECHGKMGRIMDLGIW